MSVRFSARDSGAEKERQFYGRLEKCVLSAGKSTCPYNSRFRGTGILGLGGGGGEMPILFLWAQGVF